MIRSAWLAGGLLALLAVPAFAAGESPPAHLVADFDPGSAAAPLEASNFARLGNRSVFVRPDYEVGPELWITDGTSQGTSSLGVLCPPCGEVALLGSTGSIAFYQVTRYDSEDGDEMRVWRTDGTAAGTFPVTSPLLPPWGLPETGPRFLYGLAGARLFFTACSPAAGCELWSSDGSVTGTGPAGEAVAGPGNSGIVELAAAGGRAFLIIKDPAGGTALWLADGSAGGLKRLRDVRQAGSLIAGDAGAVRVFFIAEDGAGREVWTSDGTAAGTHPMTRFAPRDPFGPYPWLQFAAGRVFFRADDGAQGFELWSLAAGTGRLRRVTSFREAQPSFSGVTPVGDRLLFLAVQRFRGGSYTVKLWSSRGDFRSTAPLAGCPGGCPVPTSRLEPAGPGRLVFAGGHAQGEGFWVTDGTAAGTRLLRRTSRSHELVQSVAAGGRVLFEVTDEYEIGELWITDGTVAGTFLSGHGGPHWSHYYGWAARLQAGAAGDHTLFPARNSEETYYDSLWTSDGTARGTVPLKLAEAPVSSHPWQLTRFRDGLLVQDCAGVQSELRMVRGDEATLLRSVRDESCYRNVMTTADLGDVMVLLSGPGGSLLRTDGTPEGTSSFQPSPEAGTPHVLARFGGQAVLWMVSLNANPPVSSQLWLTDGSPAGTRKLLDLPSGVEVINPAGISGRLYFFDLLFRDGDFEWTPWVSDGTAQGTRPLTTGEAFLAPGRNPDFIELGGRAFFPVRRGKEGPLEIWSTDGTPAGTKPAVTAASGWTEPGDLVAAGDRLYFAARRAGDPSGRLLPWVSDGTDAGTHPLADVSLAETPFIQEDHPRFAELDGRVFFAAIDPAHGDELWSTDGTPEGTARLLDIAPGALGSYPRGLAVWQGRLWFRARDAVHGMELWTSDGTAAGTHLVQDIAADGSWSVPQELTPTDAGLYFTANDGVHGRELWVVEAP
ncbi:MAG: hypothetical protein ACJ75H_18210 [Thermoanaerobaculia bacterium]